MPNRTRAVRKIRKKKNASSSRKSGNQKKKKRRTKPGKRALREIKQYQTATNTLIPKKTFSHVARDCFDRVLNKPSREDLHEYLDSYHLRYPTEFCVEDEFADKDGNVVGYNLKDVQEEFKDKEGNAKCRDKERKEFCFSSQAMSALHEAAEAHLVSLWDDANSLAVHAGRKTVFPKDFESAQSIRSPEQFVIDRREAQLDRDIRDLLSIRRDLRLHPRLTERQLARRHEARKNPKKNSIPRKKKDTKFRKKVAKKAPKKVARRKS